MNDNFSIAHVSRVKLDVKKWNDCITGASNGLIYAQAFYLDHTAKHWDALVLNDYEAVMPLTWNRKWGIKYLYQPAFIQQGGVFAKEKLSSILIHRFIESAAQKFRFAEITLNFLNEISTAENVETALRSNYVLQLGAGYTKIKQQYNPYIIQRLNRLNKFSLIYKQSDDFKGAISLYKQLYGNRMTSVSPSDYVGMQNICEILLRDHRVVVRHAYSKGHELLATLVLLKDDKRLYNMISCILPAGKKLLANYFLYNEVIKEFSNEQLMLDFEGSDIKGIAYFYKKFTNNNNQHYPFLKFNRLPFPVKLLKP